ncbi:MAG: Gfo/Idh/MocA family oxidoreductase [Verrucomicrobia bacterium]|nr:Gfo/Idh/MocA family oxidoreductase [Verrucomicrobiota bacterium]MBV9274099.1 Gfo/Idh/MocA family oxidoreductase [Verrucomicrobiota bacterium]
MASKPISLGLIGTGIVAAGPYRKALERSTAVKAGGLFDPDAAKASALAEALEVRAYPDLDALLSDASIDAVAVLSPNHLHVDIALRSLRAGKHVLVEKPVAETVEEIEQLEAAAQRAGKVCMPAHNYIYNPSLIRAKRLIGEGRLGTVASGWILYNIFHPEEIACHYGGVLREVCVHHAYSLLFLLGKPAKVSAQLSRVHYHELTCEDQAMLTCTMPGGALVHLWASFAASDPTSDPWTVVYKILGTNGGIAYTWDDARYDDTGGPAWGIPNYLDGFYQELEFFVTQAIRNGETPLSTLADARDAIRIIEAAESSVAKAGTSVEVHY